MSTKKFYQNIDYKYYMSIKCAIFKLSPNWVVAYRPVLIADEKGIYFTEWAQGHYFENYEEATRYIAIKLNDYMLDLQDDLEDTLKESNQIITSKTISDLWR